MGKRPAPFTEADIARVLRAIKKAGLPIFQIEIDMQGKIVVRSDPISTENINPWDAEFK